MRKILIISLLMLMLSACQPEQNSRSFTAPETEGVPVKYARYHHFGDRLDFVILPNGLECVTASNSSGRKGGVSCNWDKYNKQDIEQ